MESTQNSDRVATTGELLGAAWQSVIKNFWQLLGLYIFPILVIALIVFLVAMVLVLMGGADYLFAFVTSYVTTSMLLGILLAVVIGLFGMYLQAISQVGMLKLLADNNQSKMSFKDRVKSARSHAWSYVAVTIMMSLLALVTIGIPAIIVFGVVGASLFNTADPGIPSPVTVVPLLLIVLAIAAYVFVHYGNALIVNAIEGKHGKDAFKRSKALVKGRAWAVFGRMTAIFVIIMVIAMVLNVAIPIVLGIPLDSPSDSVIQGQMLVEQTTSQEWVLFLLELLTNIFATLFIFSYGYHLYASLAKSRPAETTVPATA